MPIGSHPRGMEAKPARYFCQFLGCLMLFVPYDCASYHVISRIIGSRIRMLLSNQLWVNVGGGSPDSNFSLQQACHKFVMTRVQVCHKFVMTSVQACSKLAAS
ncbi:hypothetical protein AVEN_107745-1 [Araneus ventricosus]|uniref:Uncharacterized protein n=1 Tax=Araneus ventricosus TaxID=182803 RepID=A0A4Y2UVI4_ARAVE|nr:hypothetical protein AVEN_107745-1 [Araneus ventricosus]